MASSAHIVSWNAGIVKSSALAAVGGNMNTATKFVEKTAKKNASNVSPSAPGEGPGVVSGAHRSNIRSKVDTGVNEVRGSILVGMPYSLRLELGFTGTDALGRVYNQAPRPHIRPALFDNTGHIFAILSGGF